MKQKHPAAKGKEVAEHLKHERFLLGIGKEIKWKDFLLGNMQNVKMPIFLFFSVGIWPFLLFFK